MVQEIFVFFILVILWFSSSVVSHLYFPYIYWHKGQVLYQFWCVAWLWCIFVDPSTCSFCIISRFTRKLAFLQNCLPNEVVKNGKRMHIDRFRFMYKLIFFWCLKIPWDLNWSLQDLIQNICSFCGSSNKAEQKTE